MGEAELIFDFLEMKKISYQCGKCKTTVVFDVTSTDTQIPNSCPCCGNVPNAATIKRCLNAYRNIYQEISKASQEFTFQFRVTPPPIKD